MTATDTAAAGVEAGPAEAAPATAGGLPTAYWRQWSGSAISNLGDGINFVAMPLLALSLTADERLISAVAVATFVPWLLLALPVGVVVDRVDRQSLMITANVVRVVLFALIAVGAVLEVIEIWHLLAVLLVIGSGEVLFDSTAQAFLPMLVEPHQLAKANGLLFAAEVVAGSLAGLAVGALLFDASPGLPFAANAISFAIAAALIAAIRLRRRVTPKAGPAADLRLREGLRWLMRHRLLRTLALMVTLTNLGLMLGQGIFVKFAIEELDLTNLEFGILLAIAAMGAASGGLIGARVVARLGIRSAVLIPYVVFGVGTIVIGVASDAWLVGAAGFVVGVGITVWNVATVTLRQQLIPAEMFGRVNAVYRWLGAAASAAGIAAGGFLAYETDLRTPYVTGGAVSLIALVVFARPILAGLRADLAEAG